MQKTSNPDISELATNRKYLRHLFIKLFETKKSYSTNHCKIFMNANFFCNFQCAATKEDTILVYRRDTNGIQNDRKPQCTEYKVVLYRQSYQVGYWRVPTVRYLPLSRLPTLLSGRYKSASCPFQELQYRRRYSVWPIFLKLPLLVYILFATL